MSSITYFPRVYCPMWVYGTYIITPEGILHVRELLAQDKVWCCNNNVPAEFRWIELELMTDEHKRNLLKWLMERAARYKPWWRFFEDPERWMRRQPLVLRLQSLLDD
jgi:hypothetical protein